MQPVFELLLALSFYSIGQPDTLKKIVDGKIERDASLKTLYLRGGQLKDNPSIESIPYSSEHYIPSGPLDRDSLLTKLSTVLGSLDVDERFHDNLIKRLMADGNNDSKNAQNLISLSEWPDFGMSQDRDRLLSELSDVLNSLDVDEEPQIRLIDKLLDDQDSKSSENALFSEELSTLDFQKSLRDGILKTEHLGSNEEVTSTESMIKNSENLTDNELLTEIMSAKTNRWNKMMTDMAHDDSEIRRIIAESVRRKEESEKVLTNLISKKQDLWGELGKKMQMDSVGTNASPSEIVFMNASQKGLVENALQEQEMLDKIVDDVDSVQTVTSGGSSGLLSQLDLTGLTWALDQAGNLSTRLQSNVRSAEDRPSRSGADDQWKQDLLDENQQKLDHYWIQMQTAIADMNKKLHGFDAIEKLDADSVSEKYLPDSESVQTIRQNLNISQRIEDTMNILDLPNFNRDSLSKFVGLDKSIVTPGLNPLQTLQDDLANTIQNVVPSGESIRSALQLEKFPMLDVVASAFMMPIEREMDKIDSTLKCNVSMTTGTSCQEVAAQLSATCGGDTNSAISYIGSTGCKKRAACEYINGEWIGEVPIGLVGFSCR
eukprot:GHVH01007071.1.p1 GENE.GHVH01007071.1~~GHVH01007071.1.p1  ORF type:complete len:602 (-),score=85.25 GHVH01007071.1:770-2575(-)